MSTKDLERFLEKVVMLNGINGCWTWRAGKANSKGYGGFTLNGKQVQAHRASFEHYKGKIPHGLHVCHKCDNVLCVNPDHLFLGTNEDNIRDSYKKDKGPSSKLTSEQVVEVRRMLSDGQKHEDIAKKFKVTAGTVSNINTKRCWSYVKGGEETEIYE